MFLLFLLKSNQMQGYFVKRDENYAQAMPLFGEKQIQT